MDIVEMKQRVSEKLKTAERHRQDTCEYLNSPSRLKDEEICKRVDSLLFMYRQIGNLEGHIIVKEMLEKKTEKTKEVESIH